MRAYLVALAKGDRRLPYYIKVAAVLAAWRLIWPEWWPSDAEWPWILGAYVAGLFHGSKRYGGDGATARGPYNALRRRWYD